MHITKTTRESVNEQQQISSLDQFQAEASGALNTIIGQAYQLGFREGQEANGQTMFDNGQISASGIAAQLAHLKEAGLLFNDWTFEDIFTRMSFRQIEEQINDYFNHQAELAAAESETDQTVRNAIHSLYTKYGKEAVTKMWDTIKTEDVAVVPDPLPFD